MVEDVLVPLEGLEPHMGIVGVLEQCVAPATQSWTLARATSIVATNFLVPCVVSGKKGTVKMNQAGDG